MNPHQFGELTELEIVEIELLLEGIYRHYGYDFRDYSYSSLVRRIKHRMQIEQVETITGLLDLVLRDAMVMKRLFEDFSIKVTEMFRDPDFFLCFRKHVLPWLKSLPTIRIWNAGCSTGEEVYSMAILLYEEGLHHKTMIYATDMSEDVIERASRGMYPLDKMKHYTKNYQRAGGKFSFSEYYTIHQNEVVLKQFLSKNIVFSQHNLATDQSFNEFHVIICRNVLIYFNRNLQFRVFRLFHESLTANGLLGLGSKEVITTSKHKRLFKDFLQEQRIYRKQEETFD